MLDDGAVDETVLGLLREALGPHASVEATRFGTSDLVVIRQANGKVVRMEPRSPDATRVRESAATPTLYVLRRAPRRVHDEFRRAGASFVDVSGTVHLALPTLLVDRGNLRVPARRGVVRQSFDPFSDRGSLVVRTLLEQEDDPRRAWGVRELAAASGVSPATATRVVRELERHGVQVVRRGRSADVRLVDAAALFAAWTRRYDWTRNASAAFNAPMGDPDRFLARMARTWTGPRWALTLQAGASRVAPHATWNRVHVYVDAPDAAALVQAGAAQGWEPDENGSVVLMRPWYRTSVWHGVREIGGAPVVSTLQLALDLWHYPLRGREQGEHLLRTVLGLHV